MHTANEHASALGIEHIEYRDDIPHQGFPVLEHKVNMVLSLPDSEEELWTGFTSKLRAQIRRPQRENTETLIGREELANAFYRVYARNMRDLGSPAHSKRFVINMLQHFPQNSWIIVVRLDNRPVAAGFLLGMGDTLEIPLASTIREVNPLSMNMLLYWEVLKFAIENGYKNFDFGRSSLDAGTYRFKKQWGARPKQLYWHYWLGESGELPSLNPANPKYALVINLWKRLPLALANWLGPLIVKHLP
jgi:FemAB-related protein (PEP-CTERM system-associated)